MKRKYSLLLAMMCIAVLIFGGCAGGSKSKEDALQSNIDSANKETEGKNDIQNTTGNTESEMLDNSDNNPGSASKDSDLETELDRYRQDREDTIKEENGLVEGGSPDGDYSFDLSGTNYAAQFDTRELTEAYAAARIYVTDTLGYTPKTKMAVYMCIDPRMLEIYEDTDKGVAAGYDNSDIFVCEYCSENNGWQYLVLVRDGKGSSWNVIYNGSSYKEQ